MKNLITIIVLFIVVVTAAFGSIGSVSAAPSAKTCSPAIGKVTVGKLGKISGWNTNIVAVDCSSKKIFIFGVLQTRVPVNAVVTGVKMPLLDIGTGELAQGGKTYVIAVR